MRKLIVFMVAVGVCMSGAIVAQKRLDASRSHQFDEQLLYLPTQPILTYCTGGMNSVVADLLWLRCIQYTSQQFHGDYKFTWLAEMCTVITRLDPNFTGVYQWGGVFLAMLKHDNDASIELLKSGIPSNPERWELPFEIARTYILNRHDEIRGARWLAVAAATGNPPQFVVDWAKNIQKRHSLYDVERGMWQDILTSSGDANMRATAQQKLQELTIREACDAFTVALKRYEAQTGKHPASLNDVLQSGLVPLLPLDKMTGKFFIDSKGIVQNTTVLDSVKAERLQVLRGWIDTFHEKQGRWPNGLDELKADGTVLALPSNPYENAKWQYDPTTGAVQ